MTLSVRDATETYLELGQRIPIYLNGEIQIAWVLEQGLVDMAFIVKTFGVSALRRDQVITRGPRFQIAFDANAQELVQYSAGNEALTGPRQTSPFGQFAAPNSSSLSQRARGMELDQPKAEGRYELQRCKVDSVSLGIMPGRRVAAVRWEGVAEGITYIPKSIQEFKNGLLNPSPAQSGYNSRALSANQISNNTVATSNSTANATSYSGNTGNQFLN